MHILFYAVRSWEWFKGPPSMAASGFVGRTASYNREFPTLSKDACGKARREFTGRYSKEPVIDFKNIDLYEKEL